MRQRTQIPLDGDYVVELADLTAPAKAGAPISAGVGWWSAGMICMTSWTRCDASSSPAGGSIEP